MEIELWSVVAPLVPDVARLTDAVVDALSENERNVVEKLKGEISGLVNIETILTQVRRLAQAIGTSKVHGLDGKAYEELGQRICQAIREEVRSLLPIPTLELHNPSAICQPVGIGRRGFGTYAWVARTTWRGRAVRRRLEMAATKRGREAP